MRLVMPFRRPFEALEEALQEAGCDIERNWKGQPVDAVLVDFCDAIRHPIQTWMMRHTMQKSAPLVAIARDAPWHKGIRRHKVWMARRLKPFDIYASHSLQQAQGFAHCVLYLPNAARLSHYCLGELTLADLRDPRQYRHQVSFIGNMNASRYPEHRSRVDFLITLQQRLAGVGISLDLIDSASGISEKEQVTAIQSSLINLNYGAACDQGNEKSWGLPERCYGIPACGGFLISDERIHADDDFVPEREWIDYKDIESCIARIRYFIAHPNAARDIAEAAHAKVIKTHSYRHRAKTLINAISLWKND